MKTRWGDNPTLHFRVKEPFWKYQITTKKFGYTRVGGVTVVLPELEFERYEVGVLTCIRYGRDSETGWHTWLADGHSIPISGYELHALCINKTIEEIEPTK